MRETWGVLVYEFRFGTVKECRRLCKTTCHFYIKGNAFVLTLNRFSPNLTRSGGGGGGKCIYD